MHKNYFLFEKQLNEIKPGLLDKAVEDIFSFRKNELVLETGGEDNLFLMISLSVNIPYFFVQKVTAIKQPRFNLFEGLKSQFIRDIKLLDFDKCLHIYFDDFQLEILFFGAAPNIILKNKNKRIVETFKEYQQQNDLSSTNPVDFRTVTVEQLQQIAEKEPGQEIQYFLKRHLTALNKLLVNEIIFRSGLDDDLLLSDMEIGQWNSLSASLQQLNAELKSPESFIYLADKKYTRLSAVQLNHLDARADTERMVFDSLNKAWQRFVFKKTEQQKIDKIQQQCRTAIDKRQKYLERSLKSIAEIENLERRKEEAELKGNLLLTFMRQIQPHQSEVTLDNIFSDHSEKIRIKLNSKKTIIENANQYFNKYKNIDKQKLVLSIKKDTYKDELEQMIKLKNQLEPPVSGSKTLSIITKLQEMNIIQTARKSTKSQTELRYSFNRLILEKEWDIFIGKSGENNDLLTFGFANKWDIWLHAQGVPGSHVIIRLPRRDFHPPQSVIEQAAQIAAANSKAKHSSTVPVIYTEARHVSRIRKAAPGTVKVTREKVIFVKPLLLNA